MSYNKERNCTACSCIGIVLSVVFGAIIGILFAFDFIPFIVISTWIALGIGILALIILIAGVFLSAMKPQTALHKCTCKNAFCLLAGSIGTIITSIAALSIVLTNAFISVIILVAIAAFFFALLILGLISFIKCIVNNICCSKFE